MIELIRARGSLRLNEFSTLLIAIILYNGIMASQVLHEKPSMLRILENLKSLPSNLTEIEELPLSKFGNSLSKLKPLSGRDRIIRSHQHFKEQTDHINNQYEKLQLYKKSSDDEKNKVMKLYEVASESINDGDHNVSYYLRKLIDTIIPRGHHHGGLFRSYSRYIKNLDRHNYWCEEGQSVNYFIYNSFRYTLDIIRKGYSIILQSYAIRNAFDEGHFDAIIDSVKAAYASTANRIATHFQQLANGASTRLAPCDPQYRIRNKTYLEMEKFLQGILPPEITLNERNSAYGDCEDYKHQGTPYYPYTGVRHNGDWKCHGLMYDCFEIPSFIDICKPSMENRRIDGWLEITCYSSGCLRKIPYKGMGRLKHCDGHHTWDIGYWRSSLPITLFKSEQCACICDDIEHPKTLRRFSREYAISDYKNNMVVTGIRIVSISNVIHIQIQEGKLERFGFISPASVHWREKNDVVTNDDGGDDVVTLSYHKRRVNLDVFYYTPNDTIIGAAFDWDDEKQGVQLSVFATAFSFSTGKLNAEYRKRLPPHGPREEIVLEKRHIPTRCHKNIPIRGDKFIKFQTSDWNNDAAQTTIPYLDIQPVITRPPTMLRGVGLYYKGDTKCGGYIGLELYSHDYENLIFYNNTLY